jgi:predicted 3-demethylubiquinone-9 3-methyltransferase (glyoxalase superfamily)
VASVAEFLNLPKVSVMLWYEGTAEEAARHYVKAFKDGKINRIDHYPDSMPGAGGSVMTVGFELAGASFVGLNAGPMFKPTEATSICVMCDTQKEVDFLWEHLAEGGSHSNCGWLKDRWGFSWQVTPRRLIELTTTGTADQRSRVFAAMMEMRKLDIAKIEAAAKG